MNRRRALASLAAIVAAIGAAFSVPFARRARRRRLNRAHQRAGPDSTPVDSSVVELIALFSGALFGHTLKGQELRDMRANVELVAQTDGGWRPEFALIANFVDRRARAHGAQGFADASDDVRERIVDEIMRPATKSRRSELLALVSEDERTRRFLRSDAVGVLARAYRSSGAAWRRRGYARWPGIPGDPREYTRQGPAYRC
ncbi:MAG: hypothetical protein ACREOG_02755 [Gemmatimonadaceae bacterium]